MVIWVQFLAPDLTALPILDFYVRWRLGERRIGVGDGSKIQIRLILIREQALVGLANRARDTDSAGQGSPQAESAERRVNATERQPKC